MPWPQHSEASLSVDTGLCPWDDSSRAGVGVTLRYPPLDASASEAEVSRCCRCGDSGPGNARRSPPGSTGCEPLFDSPQSASHSMPHGYSFALEYARSACWGDCTSTMLSRKGFTFRDPGSGH